MMRRDKTTTMTIISNLPSLVRDKFKKAQASDDLTFYQTQVFLSKCNGLPVRFSPALADKPKSDKPKDPNKMRFDPFEDPLKGLLITELDSYNLVLNKFPVIPDHFILATKEYKEQTHVLEEADITAAYACLQSYRANEEELFGFFNSGEHSGASQPHRHIQFLPVASMRSGMSAKQSWNVLADSLVSDPGPDLPFTYYASPIRENDTPTQLYEIYVTLFLMACKRVLGTDLTTSKDMVSPISYNLGITDHAMVLCPRTSEGIKVEDRDGKLVGPVSLNGTLLGGTLLVKSEKEWEALRSDESKLKKVLSSIGIAPTNFALNERL